MPSSKFISSEKYSLSRPRCLHTQKPSPVLMANAKHDASEDVRKEKTNYMNKIFRLCNPKYHPHLTEELDYHSQRNSSKKPRAMTVDNLGILIGVQGVDIKRVLKH